MTSLQELVKSVKVEFLKKLLVNEQNNERLKHLKNEKDQENYSDGSSNFYNLRRRYYSQIYKHLVSENVLLMKLLNSNIIVKIS